jgi:hypothetical protein
MTLLKAVDNLNHRIEALDSPDLGSDSDEIEPRDSPDYDTLNTGNSDVDGLGRHLAKIEQDLEKSIGQSFSSFKVEMDKVQQRWNVSLVRPPWVMTYLLVCG